MEDIFKIKEAEIVRKFSCIENCTSTCRVFHEKHNWFKSSTQELHGKFEEEKNLLNHIDVKYVKLLLKEFPN